ncbi:MAG: formylglycine-generating enzyme family protein [Chloroflexi bacterium]|nr:formylglycine-generating enzyme family protein [Chloroflexota bacterium]
MIGSAGDQNDPGQHTELNVESSSAHNTVIPGHTTPHADEPPMLDAVLAQLRRRAEARRAALATQLNSDIELTLQRIGREIGLLEGIAATPDVLTDVRQLIAGGVARWRLAETQLSDDNLPWFIPWLMRQALWPLVIAKQLPNPWFTALYYMASLPIALVISDVSSAYRPDNASVLWTQLAHQLAEPRCAQGTLRLLDDWSDPRGGWPVLADAFADRDGRRPEPPRDWQVLLRILSDVAVGSVLGNRADALVARLVDTLVHLAAQQAAPQISTSSLAQPDPPTRSSSASETLSGKARTKAVAIPVVDQMQFCLVPVGPFWMGSPDSDKDAVSDEKPLHQVDIDHDYWMGRYPVTVAEFGAFVRATGYRTISDRHGDNRTWQHPGGPGTDVRSKQQHPVTLVSWYDAQAYCDWLTGITGLTVSLPSEAEWEKAARGGLLIPAQPIIGRLQTLRTLAGQPKTEIENPQSVRRYPWGDEPPDRTRCNINTNEDDTTPVSKYSPRGDSPYGCGDMAGNIWEWCQSKYKSYPYKSDDGREKTDPSDDRRVLRGVSWSYDLSLARSPYRFWYFPVYVLDCFGFRVVVRLAPVL